MHKKLSALVLSLSLILQSGSLAFAQDEAKRFDRLEKFNKKTSSTWQVRLNKRRGTPRSMVGGRNLRVGKNESSVRSFLKSHADFLGVDRSQLKLKLQSQSPAGTHFYFDQVYKNLPVANAYVKVSVGKNGDLLNYQSTYVQGLNIDTNPAKTAVEAAGIPSADGGGQTTASQLVIYSQAEGAAAKLAWKLSTQTPSGQKWDIAAQTRAKPFLAGNSTPSPCEIRDQPDEQGEYRPRRKRVQKAVV